MPEYGERPARLYWSRDVSGGVNNKLFPIDIADNEAVKLQNIDTSIPGLRQKRAGTTLTATGFSGSGSGYFLALTHFAPTQTIGDRRLLAVTRGSAGAGDHKALWEWCGSGDWSYVGSLTGLTGGEDFSWIHGFDLNIPGGYVVAMISNNDSDGYWYNGATLGSLVYGAGQPSGNVGDFFLGRAFISGAASSNNRHAVYYSDVVSFTTTGFANANLRKFDMGGGTGQKVIAIKGFRDQELVVFMEDRIEELLLTEQVTVNEGVASYADPRASWSRRAIHTSIGCSSKDTVVNVGEDLFFQDQHGHIRSLARTINDALQGVVSVPISDKIQGTVDRISKNHLRRAHGVFFNGKYLWAVPVEGETFPSEVWVYDLVRQSWDGPWTDINPKDFAVGDFDASTASTEDKSATLFYASKKDDSIIGRMYRGSDDLGNAIAYQEISKRLDYGALDSNKTWFRYEGLFVASASMGVLVEAIPDAGTSYTLGVFNPEGGSVFLPLALPYIIGDNVIKPGKFSMEPVPRSRDVQISVTVTTTSDVKYLGHMVQGWVEAIDDTVVDGS